MKKRLFIIVLLFGCLVTMKVQNVTAATYSKEYRAVWFAYYDYQSYLNSTSSNNASNFRTYFRKVCRRCKDNKFNRIIVHVRPYGDAIYKSKYFPTSKFIARSQGASLSYDPLQIMVSEAHSAGLKIEAWVNPYRVASNTNYSALASSNQARKWHNYAPTRRYVIAYKGALYFNPSIPAVRNLIVNGVKEIVQNYNVDGIHFDDYFYPEEFSVSEYNKVFDAYEYNRSEEKKAGMTIEAYRRKQVNALVKHVYSAVKKIKPGVTFGISPDDQIDMLTSKYGYYVDIKKWVNNSGYVDYITPQLYNGFTSPVATFDKEVKEWTKMVNRSKVKLYIGLAGAKAGNTSYDFDIKAEKAEWKQSTVLSKMINYSRSQGVDGFSFFDYSDLYRLRNTTILNKMQTELAK